MFPLPITTWLKLGAVAITAALFWYMGYSFEAARFDRYKAAQAAETRVKEKEYQAAADKIEKEKNAQIADINSKLADAISELRKRPSRSDKTPNKQSCSGSSLYAEDAEFLVREAARADQIRAGLMACYQQYDSIK